MIALVFATQAAAETAQATIAKAMGLGDPGDTTARWDDPKPTIDGKWCIAVPDARFMPGMPAPTNGVEIKLPSME